MATSRIMWMAEYRNLAPQLFETEDQAQRIGATYGDVARISKVEIRKIKS